MNLVINSQLLLLLIGTGVSGVCVSFKTYTRQNQTTPTWIRMTEDGLFPAKDNSLCHVGKIVVLIIHGFYTTAASQIWTLDGPLFNQIPSVDTIIYVDWSDASQKSFLQYADLVVKHTVPLVYKTTLGVLEGLKEGGCEKIFIIGHSLGAHIAGNSARLFQAAHQNETSVDLIIGLDPAGPEFDKNINFEVGITIGRTFRKRRSNPFWNDRGWLLPYAKVWAEGSSQYYTNGLTKGDADYVLVIHSDPTWYGMSARIGDMDVDVPESDLQAACDWIRFYNDKIQGCSHAFAITYFRRILESGIDNLYTYIPRDIFEVFRHAVMAKPNSEPITEVESVVSAGKIVKARFYPICIVAFFLFQFSLS